MQRPMGDDLVPGIVGREDLKAAETLSASGVSNKIGDSTAATLPDRLGAGGRSAAKAGVAAIRRQ